MQSHCDQEFCENHFVKVLITFTFHHDSLLPLERDLQGLLRGDALAHAIPHIILLICTVICEEYLRLHSQTAKPREPYFVLTYVFAYNVCCCQDNVWEENG
jgi:hypothetical protein